MYFNLDVNLSNTSVVNTSMQESQISQPAEIVFTLPRDQVNLYKQEAVQNNSLLTF